MMAKYSSKSGALRWPVFYKEWIKMRLFIVASLLATLCIGMFCIFNLSRMIELKGAAHAWIVILQRDALFVQWLHYVPVLVGVLAAVVQFAPEMAHKRLKLMLHLPKAPWRTVGSMVGFGLCFMLIYGAANVGMVVVGLSQMLAYEMVVHIFLTMFPWFLSGCVAYVLTVFICIEPTWRCRMAYIAMAIAILRIFFISDKPEAYNHFLVPMFICLLAWMFLPLLSIERFKDGKQN